MFCVPTAVSTHVTLGQAGSAGPRDDGLDLGSSVPSDTVPSVSHQSHWLFISLGWLVGWLSARSERAIESLGLL